MSKNKVQFQKGLSLTEFLKDYGSEEKHIETLVNLHWPNGFECLKYKGKVVYF
jgi:hypothetical protein